MAFGWFKKIKDAVVGGAKTVTNALVSAVQKTQKAVFSGLRRLVGRRLDEDAADELYATLIQADLGPRLAEELVEKAKSAYQDREIKSEHDISQFLRDELAKEFPPQDCAPIFADKPPTVILMVGVNGSGKTTTCARLAHLFKQQGLKVLLAAADTFRAAAIEQLELWAKRVGCDIVKGTPKADPASVAFNAVEKAIAQEYDLVIIDTAGRLHNKKNLMNELEKIGRVLKKQLPDAPHEVLLVLDGTTGQNAVRQAQEFTGMVGVTGLVVTKLDGSAKGGAVLSMRSEVALPVKWIGLGEKMEDIQAFDAETFLDAVFSPRQDEDGRQLSAHKRA